MCQDEVFCHFSLFKDGSGHKIGHTGRLLQRPLMTTPIIIVLMRLYPVARDGDICDFFVKRGTETVGVPCNFFHI